ncbi:MAG: GGDEF domain-containing protein [Oscillospiraceae bacterium]
MNSKEILTINMKKHWRGYEAFMMLIAALEGMMMVYGIVNFDFHDLRRKLYFASYVFLFVCTVGAFILNRIFMKKERYENGVIQNACVYNVVLILWSSMISALDMVGGGYPVTYMTILAAVGSLIALHPLMYSLTAVLASGCMIAVVMFMGNPYGLSVPFFLNHIIFLLVVITVETRNYRSTREQYMLDKRLEELASVDGLTKVANRRSLDSYMAQLMQEKSLFSFVLIDVDNFKSINDTYGHQEGDNSLVHISDILKDIFGEHVFRYGGDEFAVVSFENAENTAEKMELVNRRLNELGTEYVLQTCSGVYYNEEQDDERRIFELADSALYEAKHNGKARSVIYGKQL